MTDAKARLIEAADYLDELYRGSKHIPADLVVHAQDIRGRLSRPGGKDPVAQFFYGGAAEVFLTLGPAVLPMLSLLLLSEADGIDLDRPVNSNALSLAKHILKTKETTS